MPHNLKATKRATFPATPVKQVFLWDYVLVVAVYVVALISVGTSLRHHYGFPLDDSWIHQTVGRNFALYRSLEYLLPERSSGSTSLFTPLLALGVNTALRRVAHLSSAPAAVVAAIGLVIFGAFCLPLWRSVLAADVDHIQDSHGAMAAFLKRLYPEQKIAVFDIGRIGYDRDGNLIDLGGLVGSSYIPFLYSNRVPQYLREHDVSMVVLPFDGSDSPIGRDLHLVGNPNLLLTPIHVDCTSQATWRLGWVETRHAARCQQLYEIKFR